MDEASEARTVFCSGEGEKNGKASLHADGRDSNTAKEEVRETVRSLVERFGLSRDDLVSAYDECMQDRDGREVRSEKNGSASLQRRLELTASSAAAVTPRSADVQVNGVSEGAMELQEVGEEQEQSGEDEDEDEIMKEEDTQRETSEWERKNGSRLDSVSDSSPLEEKEVDKMQTLVQSALRVYEASSHTPELGQKRRSFTLEDELNLPSSFAQELLEYVPLHLQVFHLHW